MKNINPFFLATGLVFLVCGYAWAGGSIEFLGNFSGGNVGAPVVFTGDNSGGVGTLRIRPSDEDTQLVLCEASNNASPEVCSSWSHANFSTTEVYSLAGANVYFNTSTGTARRNTSFGSSYTQYRVQNSNDSTGLYLGGLNTSGAALSFFQCFFDSGGTTATCTLPSTTTLDSKKAITNSGSATCNGIGAGTVCVNDPAVFYDASATYTAHFGSSAANSSTQIWEYTQGTAGQATTLFATGAMASPTVAGAVGYYGSTYPDADVTDDLTLYAVGKEINIIRSDNVGAASVHTKWIEDASASPTAAGTTLMTLLGDGTVKPTMYGSQTNCSDGAGAAACSAAPAGSFVVDNGTTSTVVSTTAVTANSQILIQFDAGLGTKLGVTCNTNATNPYVTARTAGTSFTVQAADPAGTDPACFSYFIVN